MNGMMRVSIVATALDGQKPDSKTVLNMVNRIQNRNNGYSDSLFPKNTPIENNTFNSINGATALKLDEEYEANESPESLIASEPESNISNGATSEISLENASYLENNPQQETITKEMEEHTPQLFSNDSVVNTEEDENKENEIIEKNSEESLFDQDINEEEDFEIPAFLRRQKF